MAACPSAIKTYALCMSMQIVTYYTLHIFTLGDFDVKLHVNACSSLRNFVFRLFQSLFHDGLDLDSGVSQPNCGKTSGLAPQTLTNNFGAFKAAR